MLHVTQLLLCNTKNEYSFTTLWNQHLKNTPFRSLSEGLDPNSPLLSLKKQDTLPFIATPQNRGVVPSGYAKWGEIGLGHSLMVQ